MRCEWLAVVIIDDLGECFAVSLVVAMRLSSESPRTTKLYDRTKDEITMGEVERIQL